MFLKGKSPKGGHGMKIREKLRERRGFSLTELLIVVAIIALLAGIGAAVISPLKIKRVEYNRNAESIATAVQNRLTSLRNAGQLDMLRDLGEPAAKDGASGGMRYLFSYTEEGDGTSPNPDMNLILPFGSIETEIAGKYYAVAFHAESGLVESVFWRETPFPTRSAEYLEGLADDSATREAEKIGYYGFEATGTGEVAPAQLPTPQITVSNYEELIVSVYLPEVRQLKGKKLALRFSLGDEKDEVYAKDSSNHAALTYDDTAIYRTYTYGDEPVNNFADDISMGVTYKIILDTPDDTLTETAVIRNALAANGTSDTPPSGKFEAWARRTKAFAGYAGADASSHEKLFKLGDNVKLTVTVFCLKADGTGIDNAFMPRMGTATFNGWFESYNGSSTVTIASGRHLQNLAKLTEMNSKFEGYLPSYTVDAAGNYTYKDASSGGGYYFTDNGGSSDISKKYKYRANVQSKITKAKQMMAIDFNCPEWKSKKAGKTSEQIPFDPINLYEGFEYYGNYLSVKHLYVDAPYYAGLFGYANNAKLYDILLVNPSVNSHMPDYVAQYYEMGVGALIGTSRDSNEIANCQTYVEKENGKDVSDLYRVTGGAYVGGLIGFCEDESIRQNSASVNVGDENSLYVGGVIGCITGDSTIKRSYGAGSLMGQYVGGLVGIVLQDSEPSGDEYYIESCYTAGHIEKATVSAAGIIGCVDEQNGLMKSALRVTGNYCAVIYGVGSGSAYTWDSTRADGTLPPSTARLRGTASSGSPPMGT